MFRFAGGAAVRGCVVAAGLALAAGPSHAEGEGLRWRFRAGEVLHYRSDQTTVTEAKVGDQALKTTLNQVVDTSWTVEKANPDGSAAMSQAIVRVRTRIESTFGAFEYDSDDAKGGTGPFASQVAPLLKALVGAKFTYAMAANGAVSDVKVPEKLVATLKRLGSTPASTGLFTEDGLRNMIAESSLELPEGAAEAGKSWSRQVRSPFPPAGSLVTDRTYTMLGAEGGAERIGVALKIALEPGPQLVADVSLGAHEGKGTYTFDPAAGRLVSSELRQKVEVVIAAKGQALRQLTDTTSAMKLVGASVPPAK